MFELFNPLRLLSSSHFWYSIWWRLRIPVYICLAVVFIYVVLKFVVAF